MPIVYVKISKTYTENTFSKNLTKVDRNKNAIFLFACKQTKRVSVSPVTCVSFHLIPFLHTRWLKMDKCVSTLLTILVSLLAVYQLNCLLIVLNITTFQRPRVILLRAMDSALGQKGRSFVQRHWAHRRYWVRPRHTRAWWNNFLSGDVVDEEWKENFRMCKVNFYKLCGELHPFIEKQTTVIHSSVEVERQVALTLYHLIDEGWLRKNS